MSALAIGFGFIGAGVASIYVDKTKQFEVVAKICYALATLFVIFFALVSFGVCCLLTKYSKNFSVKLLSYKLSFILGLFHRWFYVSTDIKVRKRINFAWFFCVGFWILRASVVASRTGTGGRVYVSCSRGNQRRAIVALWVSG
jgi:uncharacterized membrane protein